MRMILNVINTCFFFLTEQVDKSTAECVEDGEHVSDSERSRKFAAVVAQSE